MSQSIYETNFNRLVKLNICSEIGALRENGRSQSEPFMDLVFEKLDYPNNFIDRSHMKFSIVHYFEQNGDLCQDPEMVLMLYPKLKAVEAISFQQAIPPIYQEVYTETGEYYPKLKKDLNLFLKTWLNNLIDQGHGKNWIQNSVEMS